MQETMRGEAISPARRIRRALMSTAADAPAVEVPLLRSRARAVRAVAADVRDTLEVFVVTRLLVWLVAVAGSSLVNFAGSGNSYRHDIPGLSHPFGGLAGSLFTPLARWDAVWYLGIAHHGYTVEAGGAARSTAFFPLYPLLVRIFAGLSRSPGALLVASYVVSLAAFAGALYILHRLVSLELGRPLARPTLLLLAVFPGSLFFSAPYSESIFLLLSVGAFYAARTGRFAWAGCLAAAASATRSEGLVLMLPLAWMYLYGPRSDKAPGDPLPIDRLRRLHLWRLAPRYRVRRDILLIALAPLGLAAYSLHLALSVNDGFAYMHLEREWFRSFAGPLGGVWQGTVAAFDGVLQLVSGSRTHHYFAAAGGSPFVAAGHNIGLFVFLVFAVVASVGVCRRLPAPYAVYVAAALALPLSFPVGPQPLMSLPRFLAVLFPIFMWLALVTSTRRRRDAVVAVSALLLGIATVEFASWHWVA
jgi:hypothetical protein